MNKALTILLLKDEVRTMMRRVEKCNRRILAGTEDKQTEHETERKDRLIATVSERMARIAEL